MNDVDGLVVAVALLPKIGAAGRAAGDGWAEHRGGGQVAGLVEQTLFNRVEMERDILGRATAYFAKAQS